MMCAAPAYHSTQHWFLLVVTLAFLGTIFFSLYHLCLDTYLKTVNVGWLPTVSQVRFRGHLGWKIDEQDQAVWEPILELNVF